jgi:hypothetical protein
MIESSREMTPLQKLYADRAERALEIENITRKLGEEQSNKDVVKKNLVEAYDAIQSNIHASNKVAYDLHQEVITKQARNGVVAT